MPSERHSVSKGLAREHRSTGSLSVEPKSIGRRGNGPRFRCPFPQLLPNPQHAFPQLSRQPVIRRFGGFRFCGWIDRIAELHLQWCESLEPLAPRPSLMKSSNRDRHKWRVCVDRENRRAFLKRFGFAINAALSFRIQNERSPVPQAKGASPHGWDEIRIRIDYHHPQPAG